jgi:WD40 repeat protein
MKKFMRLCLAAVIILIFVRATCGPTKPFSKAPVEVMKIKDYVYYHNISITYDGKHYYTINGGNDEYCLLNEYDSQGNYMAGYDVYLDGRAIFYNPQDGELYVKDYSTDFCWIDLIWEDFDYELFDVFYDENSSPAFSPDGERIYELVDGKVRVYDFNTGEKIKRFNLSEYYDEHGYCNSVAASEDYIFIWGSKDKILVYDLDGDYVNTFKLPRLGFGFSLSYCNGLLWIAVDADAADEGGDGYWYGYRL